MAGNTLSDSTPKSIEIFYNEDDLDAIYERRLKFASDAWGAASAYDTAVTIAGYGAFFALWSVVGKDVSEDARGVSAAFMGLSLMLYICWHITMMLARHRYDSEFAATITKAQQPLDQMNEWDRIEAKKMKSLQVLQRRLWWPVFASAVGLGCVGALVLICNALAMSLNLPQLSV